MREDDFRVYPELVRQASRRSKPEDGYLNKNLKFGGMASELSSANDFDSRPLTSSLVSHHCIHLALSVARRCPRRRETQR